MTVPYRVTADVITAIDVARVTPRVRPELLVSGARGTHDESHFLLVRVTTRAGVQGLGEVSGTLTWSGEDGATAAHVIESTLAPALAGQPLAPVAALERRMDTVLAGSPFTKAGVATALWDAYARALDVPLAVALGGPVRSRVAVKCSLSGTGDRLRTALAAARAAGFTAHKLKVGLDVTRDAERLAELRELVGPEGFIGLDANGGYRRRDAARAIELFAPHTPAFLEQPVAPDDIEGMAALRGLGLCLVADESVFGMASLVRVLRADAADVVSLYIGKSGGPGRAVEMGRVAGALGSEVVIGSNGELGVGAAAQIQVACALDSLAEDFPHDIIGRHYYVDDVLSTPAMIADGVARLPDGPGLGIPLDDAVWSLFPG
ncbi:mandelate racemase/muconate lactonizing enzyme family protein [Jiangella rhizosphaerae]|uniref:Mandelate racemase n=1 Tax=Jiangella rhizosphaerae TaxID=2293569 RepID=A0A418KKZ3_9ACTN|nr:enolase C-terminal domain-like protein [Jiangella rhizosphaerae]RIQ17865.1 mandelate racemase [Jiangella rhizosphaerae]